jgi:hypothetical protein
MFNSYGGIIVPIPIEYVDVMRIRSTPFVINTIGSGGFVFIRLSGLRLIGSASAMAENKLDLRKSLLFVILLA